MQKVFITGATSFLGRNVVRHLLSKGYEVYAFVRKESASLNELPENENLHLFFGSLDCIEKVLTELSEADICLHFAWDGSGNAGRADKQVQDKNVDYSMRALEVAVKLGCKKFVFSGSQAEYGICHGSMKEDTECNPISEYGKAKLRFSSLAKTFCEDKSIIFIHLRIFSVYGTDDRDGTLVKSCVYKFNHGECMKLGPCSQMWNYLHISDFVEAIYGVIEKKLSEGIYNVGGNDTRVLREFVKEIYEVSNKTGAYEFGTTASNPEGSPALNPDISKLIKAVGWSPKISFRQGIEEMMTSVF